MPRDALARLCKDEPTHFDRSPRLIYAMLTRGEQYVERDLATMETERRDRQIKNLQRQARHFDLALVPAEQAA